ncbi:MAG: hypothetical protein WDM78_02420 [Puia sp.]
MRGVGDSTKNKSKLSRPLHGCIVAEAHLTKPNQIHLDQGRGRCQARDLCTRGCPFGGYFSSVSSTLPWAQKTGNLTINPFSVVHSIIYDETKGRATGVRVIDANTKQSTDFFGKSDFCKCRLSEFKSDPAQFNFFQISKWAWK